jgi:hypothetical protein
MHRARARMFDIIDIPRRSVRASEEHGSKTTKQGEQLHHSRVRAAKHVFFNKNQVGDEVVARAK